MKVCVLELLSLQHPASSGDVLNNAAGGQGLVWDLCGPKPTNILDSCFCARAATGSYFSSWAVQLSRGVPVLFHEAHPSLADIWDITQGSVITRGCNSIFAWLPVFCGPVALSKAFFHPESELLCPTPAIASPEYPSGGRKVPVGGLNHQGNGFPGGNQVPGEL